MLTITALQECLTYEATQGTFTWNVSPSKAVHKNTQAGSKMHNGYIRIQLNGKAYLAHRLAWFYCYGVWPSGDIDHINGVRDDNRIENLRDVPRSINTQNLRKSKKSTNRLGVTFAHGKYQASIKLQGKSYYLGRFLTSEEAHAAYLSAKRVLHKGNTL